MAEAKRVDLVWRAEVLTLLVNSSSVLCAFFSLPVFLLSDAGLHCLGSVIYLIWFVP
jgi:hypothetical protein